MELGIIKITATMINYHRCCYSNLFKTKNNQNAMFVQFSPKIIMLDIFVNQIDFLFN